MYHKRFQGNHYKIGFQWGSLLAKHGNLILDHIPFPITEERIQFAQQCKPVYQEYFPQVLEEIQGIADGQGCSAEYLQAVLFSMYAMPPAHCCSCFAVSNGEHILLGRNSDFLIALEKNNANVIYRFSSDSYAFTGNTTAFVQMEDGVNEKGLAIGLTSVDPPSIQPGMNAGLLLRFFLERCQTTEEVLRWVEKLPISSAQTFTIADAHGNIAVLECFADGLQVIQPKKGRPYVCATNLFHSEKLASKNRPDVDTWEAEPRYQTMVRRLKRHASLMDLDEAKDLLAGKNGFLCQYDRKTGKDTVWSVIYALKERRIYRAEGNPARRGFKEDRRFFFH
ncbi:MAG TPA: acyl-CoA--6-aminopenicillanic acid acyltransferase [Candidatus Scatavimonas merdigallinarum]|uniref:Acyl-CoA--6-aminopenicillanic acid acyltransferase n=1 Tax=Candidatus Scatavimonas merdigallinarum TaxID=2840914 RepID=A0A9D0ZFL3_9FIRM|nr:acyl-CoA--6-aminopenicillanic acid acyltransferase [Candidatus Scatavimonas merdigallinarum]